MLSEADAGVAGRDPDVPALPRLLDRDAFAAILGELYPDAGVTEVRPRYVRYKRGTSCLVGYRVTTGNGPIEVYARAHGPGAQDKIDKAACRERVPASHGLGVEVLAAEGLAVYPFPNDHELTGLGGFDDATVRAALLAELFPEVPAGTPTTMELLRYKPERRCVARLRVRGGPEAVIKFYTREEYPAVSQTVGRFCSAGTLRVPKRLGKSKRFRATATEWLEGVPLPDVLAGGDRERALRVVGVALAGLHAQRPRRLDAPVTAAAYGAGLVRAAEAIASLEPDLGERAMRIARRVGEKIIARRWRDRGAIHGDLAADQIVMQEDTVGVVDFDRARYGDPRIDLGTFRARLCLDELSGRLPGDVDAAFDGLLEAYREGCGKNVTRRLGRFTAGSLLHLAVEPFRYRAERWPEVMRAMLDRAESFESRPTHA